MVQIKNNEITLADLRELGKQGGATARLEDGTTVTLRHKFGTVARKGYVAGKLQDVEMVVQYVDVFPNIRTIMKGTTLIARRERRGKETILRLTGKGYQKPH